MRVYSATQYEVSVPRTKQNANRGVAIFGCVDRADRFDTIVGDNHLYQSIARCLQRWQLSDLW